MTAIGLVVMNKTTIKMLTGSYTTRVIITDKTVSIHGEVADLTDTSGNEILRVEGSADVSLLGLRIHGGSGMTGHGIQCTNSGPKRPTLRLQHVTVDMNGGIGLIAVSCALIAVSQSTFSSNTSGGISLPDAAAAFDITNTLIFRNGDGSTSSLGGLSLGATTAGLNRLAFNTIVDNEAKTNSGGVVCNIATFMGPNNIIARNTLLGDASDPNAQKSGMCTYPTSKIQTDVIGLAFQRPDMAPFSYKLLAGSTAIDQATTAVPIDVDNEGDHRPQGPEKDIGADELKP